MQAIIPPAEALHHIGSTAVPGIQAKPIIDSLVEIPHRIPIQEISSILTRHGYLLAHPDAAREYEQLKLDLWKPYARDRDGYTGAKSAFVRQITEAAKAE